MFGKADDRVMISLSTIWHVPSMLDFNKQLINNITAECGAVTTSQKVVPISRTLSAANWAIAARTLAFVAGCVMSGLTGFIGMWLAVRGNVRALGAELLVR